MKKIKITFISTFFLLLLLPLLFFNFRIDQLSAIDNRPLAENPFTEGTADFKEALAGFITDRLGFREQMIRFYTIAHDRLFNLMVHPIYEYGKDGYVFGAQKSGGGAHLTGYHVSFAAMLSQMQGYCRAREVPFVFVFNPLKNSVLREFLPPGINYDNGWVEEFLTLLDREGICYLDNTGIMIEKSREGEILFNRKYNAMHWNDLGAYYGMNNLLGKLKKDFPALHINRPEDFVITEKLNTTLPVSEFPIHEYEPLYFLRTELLNNTDEFKDKLILHPMYRDFDYRINPIRQKEGAPRALVFQGSYVTGMGYKFLANSFGEYIAIHCYQNVFDFDYYFDLFQPDCVIFETAEFTLSDTYFSLQGMENFDLEAGK